ncbi:MAG: M14 family metallopeptidase [Terriglobales bacterium]
MPYLNITEVESALVVATSAPFTGFTQLIPLPNLTWEGRQCNAIRIANGSDAGRPGVYFVGGIHSREWGSPDILINFIEQVEQAYANGTGITLGGKSFSASEIRTIVDNLDIYVFPQANPDGRNFSLTGPDSMWRKNRRTAAPNSNSGDCVGVDLNRNFDFLWDFANVFAPTSTVSVSGDPCHHDLYHGPNAFSEPETQNVKWIHDNFGNIGYYVDLHSFGQDILYSWGDDDNQTSDPNMNFQNASYNGVRGIIDGLSGAGAYLEYIPDNDRAAAVDLANAFSAAIQAVRGTNYLVEQSVGLYPTAGASDDYAYSRNFVDGSKRKVLAYTLEWGTQFQPPYNEMQNIIQEITSGLLAFCLWVRKRIETFVLITDRNTFGKDEVDAMLQVTSPARVEAAFYVVIDGFRHEELGITAGTLVGIPDVMPTISFNPGLSAGVTVQATACSTEGNVLVSGPQRFTWTLAIQFTDSSDFTQEILPVIMTASLLTTTGVTMKAQAVITFTKQPNPYEIDGQVSWLSVDLQVCQVLENGALPSTPSITLNSGPLDFISQLLSAYNNPLLPRAPNHPFDLDWVANEATSSVEIAGTIGSPPVPVYNFAMARVRYRALATPAPNVRVFFRMFQASTTSTEFQPTTTYLTGGTGGNRIPLLGVVGGEVVTIPFFSAQRVDPTNPNGLNAQTDPLNVGPLGNPIPADATGHEVQVYFGCWLDINQNSAVLPGFPASAAGPFTPVQSIQQAIKNKHQCLVAEINLDATEPQIATGATPSMSDKLAQRNLNVVGVASPHLVPITFDMKPTSALLLPAQMPDELIIDWGNLPAGSTASVYLPAVEAQKILDIANRLYTHHALSAKDDHTINCSAGGVTYIPIPAATGSNLAGLMTIAVPPDVRKGQVLRVVARQITNAVATIPESLDEMVLPSSRLKKGAIEWRRIVGSFQVSIPVQSRESLVEPEQRLLSVLRWIEKSISANDRWYLPFRRYVEQIATRVDALGGDAKQIGPSSAGDWKAMSRCRNWGWAVAALLAVLVVTIGALDGFALALGTSLLVVVSAGLLAAWHGRCHPGQATLIRMLINGLGLGAALLALLTLVGFSSPHSIVVLCVAIVLLAVMIMWRGPHRGL